MARKGFRAGSIYTVPVVGSLLVGVLCTFIFLWSSTEPVRIVIGSEGGLGPLWSSLFFVAAALVGATTIYFLVKHKKFRLVNVLLAAAFSLVTLVLSMLYVSMLFAGFAMEFAGLELAVFGLALASTFLCVLGIFRLRGIVHDFILIFLGGGLGCFLGVSIPTYSAVLILVFLALYDVFAVYRGPIGRLVSEGLERLHGVTFSFRDVVIGLGDLTFYSMLVSHALFYLGWKSGAAAFVGVTVGSFLSFKMLERKSVFPGLPFSIFLGLIAAYVGWVF